AAYANESDRITRPSASVLTISIVLPLYALKTSPGLYDDPDGRFSVAANTPNTFTGSFVVAARSTKPMTVAAPVMSCRMYSMPSAGLIEMPPESNVIPLPTTASVFLAPGAVYLMATNAGGCALPALT